MWKRKLLRLVTDKHLSLDLVNEETVIDIDPTSDPILFELYLNYVGDI